jgi:thiamine-monophosphate kinase
MNISNIGEFGFVNRLAPGFLKNLPEGVTGIGDDCAVIPWNTDESLLVTTDMLIEDVHFIRSKISPLDLGYKSLAVNLSDIAAMGATPESAFLSLGIPGDIEIEWLDEFYTGLNQLAKQEHVNLLGGDTTKSPDNLVINITVIGKAITQFIKFRSTSKQNDIICTTGIIGDSGGGLKSLFENKAINDDIMYLIRQHNRPRPHIAEGIWLARQKGVHAMMDISDGIDSDLRRIMEKSLCGAEINIDRLPISRQLHNVSEQFKWNADEIALTGGEDYCLLVTIDPGYYKIISEKFLKEFQRPLADIGLITNNETTLKYFKNGKPVITEGCGFDHFKNH